MCKSVLMEVIHRTRTRSDGNLHVLVVKHLKKLTHFVYWVRKSIRLNPSDPSDTNRFQWKSASSSHETLRKMSPILDMGVENRSDGIHRIHRTRLVSDGKVHVLVLRHLEKYHPYWMLGQKIDPMESIGSIGHEKIPMETCMFCL